MFRGKSVVAAQKFCAAAAAAATSSASCGALRHLAAHLRRKSAIAAHFEEKSSCGGVNFRATATAATTRGPVNIEDWLP